MSLFVVKLEQGSWFECQQEWKFPRTKLSNLPCKVALSHGSKGGWIVKMTAQLYLSRTKISGIMPFDFSCVFMGLVLSYSQIYLAGSEATKIACYCNPYHTHEAYVNHYKSLSLVKFVMWLSLPEAVRMNRMAGGRKIWWGWFMGLIAGAAVWREAFIAKLWITCQMGNVG
jgi:hypothetical protein